MTIAFSEVRGFRFDRIQNLVHRLADGPTANEAIERLNGELNEHDHAHKKLSKVQTRL
jgi:hypothetical protein